MITIEQIQLVDTDILFKIQTEVGRTLDKLSCWVDADYPDTSKIIDKSLEIDSPTFDNNYEFSIPLAIFTEKLDGFIFFEFTDSNLQTEKAVIGNLTPYHTCLISNLVHLDIEDNKIVNHDNCAEFTDKCGNNIYYLNALLDNIYISLKGGMWTEANKLLVKFRETDDGCCVCTECEDNVCSPIYTENNIVLW